MDVTRFPPDLKWHLGYAGTPRQPPTRIYAKPVWFVWQILGEPTTRFCRKQLLINSNIFSPFVTNNAVLHKPIPNIRNKSKFVSLQAC